MTRRLLSIAGALAIGCVSARRPDPSVSLRVMTYNIEYGTRGLDGIADAIRGAHPDLVALQEVDVHWSDRSAFVDEATLLAAKVGMSVAFAPIYRLPGAGAGDAPREFGVALLSHFPITSLRNDTLTRLSTQDANPIPLPMPGLLDATVNFRGTSVRVFNTHLDYRADPRVRARQVDEMLAAIGVSVAPTIVFGDLNAGPRAAEIQPLLRAFRDVLAGVDPAPSTYPADKPTNRIDYILVSPHFRVRSTSVPNTLASDHRPVVAELVIP